MSDVRSIAQKLQSRIKKISEDLVVDDETRSKRYEICNDCEYLVKATSTCKQCGCFMTLKTKLQRAKCPIGKW